MSESRFGGHFTSCKKHGKRLYTTRERARAAKREMGGRGKGMRAYRCNTLDGWHCGHLPPAVIEGRKTAREVYGPTTEEVNR